MTISTVYQAQAGDGVRKKRLKRPNSFFNTPEEAVSEALALKEKMDTTYKNEIEWDYKWKMTGSSEKMKILKGYLGGDRESIAFYLQIISVEFQEEYAVVKPIKPKKVTAKDKKVITKVTKLYA
ncbi:hypothetical protein [Bacillus sp. PS06]|uniref:hypothetical protein n=1 Tax=Bacillus sp. PS06 TaxID=2764176 RepID=UPI001784597B|nr:hypothetical protein [Bacillus sp. PS06]MBD8069535.1 hypothetical protein [Bacillus sp. PS06]